MALINQDGSAAKTICVDALRMRNLSEASKTAEVWNAVVSFASGRYPGVLPTNARDLVPGQIPVFYLTKEGDVVMRMEKISPR